MEPVVGDPNNHVPEVLPGDDWGDVAGGGEARVATGTVLPPRRVRGSGDTVRDQPEPMAEGLRIEAMPGRLKAGIEGAPIEVAEIGGSVLKLVPTERGARVPGVGGFKEAGRKVEPLPAAGTAVDPRHGGLGRLSLRAMLAGGGCVVVLVLAGLWIQPWISRQQLSNVAPTEKWVIEERRESMAMDAMAARVSEGMEMFRVYAVADSVDAILPLLSRRHGLDEAVVRTGHRLLKVDPSWSPSLDSNWSVIEEGGLCHAVLEGVLPDGSVFFAYFVVDEGDRLRIDWKATTAHGTASFEELARGEGDAREIRAVVVPGNYFNGAYAEERFDCYRLDSAHGDRSIWGYVAKDSELAANLKRMFPESVILEGGTTPVRLTLALRQGPGGAAAGQWEMGEMLHKDWLVD